MKILIVAAYYWPAIEWGGPTICITQLVDELNKNNLKADVLTTNSRGNNNLPKEPFGLKKINDADVFYCRAIGIKRYFFSTDLTIKLFQILKNYDVVLLQGLWTYPVFITSILCKLLNVPYILTPHGGLSNDSISIKKNKKRIYEFFFERHSINNADFLHFSTIMEKERVPKRYSMNTSIILPNLVDYQPFFELRKQLSDDVINISFVGRIHPIKGLDILIKAFSKLLKSNNNIILNIIGPDENNYLQTLLQIIKNLGCSKNIKFLGLLDRIELLPVLSRSDIFILPSRHENFGISVLEAMAANIPVIVTRYVPISQEIIANKAGIVIDYSENELFQSMNFLINNKNLRELYGINGRRIVQEKFSKNVIIENWKDLLMQYQ